MAFIWVQKDILFAFFHTKHYLCGYFYQQVYGTQVPTVRKMDGRIPGGAVDSRLPGRVPAVPCRVPV
jgi:hypothetical protein